MTNTRQVIFSNGTVKMIPVTIKLPEDTMNYLKTLELAENPNFLELFGVHTLTGDSGRSSETIALRSRRTFDEALAKEAQESKNLNDLCDQLGYDSTIDPGQSN